MHEHHLGVTRTARYYTLGDPGASVREVWVVLHGYGQLAARFARQFEPLAPHRLVVAPEGLSRYYVDEDGHRRVGASWMTREDRLAEIGDYVQYLDAVLLAVRREAPRAPLVVLGFSQGSATACRWLAQGSAVARWLVLWGGEVPPDLDLAAARERWRETAVTLVAGVEDAYITPKVLVRDAGRLRDHGIEPDVVTFPGGHVIDAGVLQRIAGG